MNPIARTLSTDRNKFRLTVVPPHSLWPRLFQFISIFAVYRMEYSSATCLRISLARKYELGARVVVALFPHRWKNVNSPVPLREAHAFGRAVGVRNTKSRLKFCLTRIKTRGLRLGERSFNFLSALSRVSTQPGRARLENALYWSRVFDL